MASRILGAADEAARLRPQRADDSAGPPLGRPRAGRGCGRGGSSSRRRRSPPAWPGCWPARACSHPNPFFAPIAAIICLGGTFGHRLRRGVEIAIGVAVGIAVGDLFVQLFGQGVWQVVLVVGRVDGAGHPARRRAADDHPGRRPVARGDAAPARPQPGSGALARRRARLRRRPARGHGRAELAAAPARGGWRPRSWPRWPPRSTPTAAALRSDDEAAADRVLERARATEDQLQTPGRGEPRGAGGDPPLPLPPAASCPRSRPTPSCSTRWTAPAATCGCWRGGPWCWSGAASTSRRATSSSSAGWRRGRARCATSWSRAGCPAPAATSWSPSARPART